jgi:hypothetical protein
MPNRSRKEKATVMEILLGIACYWLSAWNRSQNYITVGLFKRQDIARLAASRGTNAMRWRCLGRDVDSHLDY